MNPLIPPRRDSAANSSTHITQGTFRQSHGRPRRHKRTTPREHHQRSKCRPFHPHSLYLPGSPIGPRELPHVLSLHFKHLPVFSSFFFTHTDPYSSGLTASHPPVSSWFAPFAPPLHPLFVSCSPSPSLGFRCPSWSCSVLMPIPFLTLSSCYHISAGGDNFLASSSIPLTYPCPCLSRKSCLPGRGSCPH